MVWWVVFGAELLGLVAIGQAWRASTGRVTGGRIGAAADALLDRAEAAGAARRGAEPRRSVSEAAQRRIFLAGHLAIGGLVAAPAFVAIVEARLGVTLVVAAWFAGFVCSIEVATVAIVVVLLWRGWLPPFGDDGGGDDEPEPAPRPGGPYERAHLFDLRG
jgi:hypothetical protein